MNKTKRSSVWMLENSYWMFFIIITIISLSILWKWSAPKDIIEKPWYPVKYRIANIVEGKYIPLDEVSLSGTAVFVSSAKEYQDKFNSANIEHTIIQQDNGNRYYLCKVNNETYVLKEWNIPFPLRYKKVTDLDPLSGEFSVHLSRNYFMVILLSLLFIFVYGFLSYYKIKWLVIGWSNTLRKFL